MSNVSGRLRGGERMLHGYVIHLETLGAHVTSEPQADVQSDGEFSLRNVPYGEYLLKVTSYQGDAVSQQFVSIHERSSLLEVTLPEGAPTPSGGTVSFTELRHPPAKKAVRIAAAAQQFAVSGHTERAAEELQKALEISPDYAAAHSNLGVEHMRLRRFDAARAEIERAIEIAGPTRTTWATWRLLTPGCSGPPTRWRRRGRRCNSTAPTLRRITCWGRCWR
jgi:tetratricopeptide (TPR) repeat protein